MKVNRRKLGTDLEVLADRLAAGEHHPDELLNEVPRLLRRAAVAVVTPPELIGGAVVSEILGVADSNLKKVAGLPDPVVELPRGRLWDADAIRAFARRRKGRVHEPVRS